MNEPAARNLEAASPAAAAIARVLDAHRVAMQANEAAVVDNQDPEALHDFRVAIRRSRSLLKHCEGLFAREPCRQLRRHLAWIAKATGSRRDLDVFIAQLDGHARELAAPERLAPLHALLLRRQRQAHAALIRALGSERYGALKQTWRQFTEAALEQPTGLQPILAEAAHDRIGAVLRELTRLARSIRPGSKFVRLHTLRKDSKELRYLLEAFRPLTVEESDRLIAALKKMQDYMGEVCDLNIQRQLLAQYRHALDQPAALAAIDELDRRLQKQERRKREVFPKHRDKFLRRRHRRLFESLLARLMRFAADLPPPVREVEPRRGPRAPRARPAGRPRARLPAAEAAMAQADTAHGAQGAAPSGAADPPP